MAPVTLFLLLFVFPSANDVRAQKNDSNIINLGSSLSSNTNPTSWVSSNGLFSFGFYQQDNGFAIGIWLVGEPETERTIVWTSNFSDLSAFSDDSVIELTEKGLLLRNENQKDVVIANASEPADSASMLDSGNFLLYSKNHTVIWQSFDYPTDTILGGQNLSSGQNLTSKNGHFILYMNGNLVAYPVNNERESDAYWASNTVQIEASAIMLTLTPTGSLRLLDDEGNTIQVLANNSNNPRRNTSLIHRATWDLDGIFRLYLHTFEKKTGFNTSQIVWQAISDQCQVNGFCGFNSYCSNVAGKAECKCYPGFKPINRNNNGSSINKNNMFLVCEQIIENDCLTSKDPRMLYNVSKPFQHMAWGLHPYLVMPLEIEACGNSCMEDCDCGAVSHEDGSCKKYRLPLVFGRIKHNESTTALFKLPLTTNMIPSSPKKPKILVDDKKNLILTLVITLGSILFLCVIFAISIFLVYMSKVYSYRKISAASENFGFAEDCSLRTFCFDELVNATGNFKEEIGLGSFGVVYKGMIQGNNRSIAVKKLKDDVIDEGEREFRAEITAIARTHHRNLVQLIGYCIDGSRKLLVYEYMSNGSLADFLFKAEMHLSWRQRVKIALDVAKGILYLHEECEVCIVHCNIKPRDILLDEMWTAKLSDFGLARLSMQEHSRTRSANESTSGYVAPERQKEASISVKVDVYNYGVVLLEIICCRRNIDVKVASEEEIMLSSWVYDCFVRGELKKLVVDEDVEWRTFERMVKVALWCIQDDSSLRPSMKNVILMLEGLKDIPIPPSPIPPLVC